MTWLCRLGWHRWRPKGRVKQARASRCTRCGVDAWGESATTPRVGEPFDSYNLSEHVASEETDHG